MAKRLSRNNRGFLLLPIAGQLVPVDKLTDSQFLDWIRLSQGYDPLRGTAEADQTPTENPDSDDLETLENLDENSKVPLADL